MCLLFVYLNSNPKSSVFRIILASNRDEFFIRPTAPAKCMGKDPKFICGEDQLKGREGGTWLGVSSFLKIGSLLNLSGGPHTDIQELASRGFLVKEYLNCKLSATDYIDKIVTSGVKYDSFSLILIDYLQKHPEAYYYDNIENERKPLLDGIHGFSNTTINKPYKKVICGKTEFEEIIQKFNDENLKSELEVALFNLMHDRLKHFPDEVLSQKENIPKHILPEFSSKFVHIPDIGYGTRTTTIILVDYDGNVSFTEKTSTGNYTDINTWMHSEYTLKPSSTI